MKTLFAAMIALATFGGFAANAEPIRTGHDPLWTCGLTFNAHGGGFQVLVGHFELQGPGTISCVNAEGVTERLDVDVDMDTTPVALNVAFGSLRISGAATGIGVASGPRALLGSYIMANADAAAFIGAGGDVSIHGGSEALTLNVGVNFVRGFGAQVGFNKLTITEADSE